MMSLLVVAAIAVAVALGYRTKINIGLFAIAFAYLIGCFGMGLSPSEVIALWPLKIFFIIFSVCLFYSFATVNGTLEKLAEHLIYHCRSVPQLLPFAVFFTATVISAMGAGYYTVLAFMAPITLLLCERTGMSLIVGGMAVNYGALSGANFVSSQSGIIFRGLMVNAGIAENEAFVNAAGIFVSTLVIPLLVIAAHRGHHDDGQYYQMYKGRICEPVLQAMGLPHWVVSNKDEISIIGDAARQAYLNRLPVVVLLRKKALQ